MVPLWQEKQAPCTSAWSTRVAGFQVATLWQASQRVVVGICAAFLPLALVPLWQPEQPEVMPAWVNVVGVQAIVAWQVSQPAVVGICVADLPGAMLPL